MGSLKFRNLIAKIALAVLAVQNYLSTIYQRVLLRFHDNLKPQIYARAQANVVWADSLILKASKLISLYESRIPPNQTLPSLAAAESHRTISSRAFARTLVSLKHPSFMFEFFSLYSHSTLVKAGHNSVVLAINLHKSACDCEKTRIRSLTDILRNPQSPLYTSELVIWLFTRSRYVEDVLGDFRETYEALLTKHGEAYARRWSREQTLREVWNGTKAIVQVIMLMKGIYHFMAKHLRKP